MMTDLQALGFAALILLLTVGICVGTQLGWTRHTPRLKRPRGVRIEHADGTETPCELTYRGVDHDGCHIWHTDTVFDRDNGDVLRMDILPERTGIEVTVKPRITTEEGLF